MNTSQQVKREVQHAAHQAAPWVVRLARLGYASKGAVYVTLGALAARAAFGQGGKTTDTRGAIASIGEQPFGQALLVVVALGLIGYSLWQFARAALDPEGQGTGAKGLAKRLGYLLSGGAHTALALYAGSLATRARPIGGSGRNEDDWTALLLDQPFGPFLVGAVGLVALGIAASQLFVAYKKAFLKRLDLSRLPADRQRLATRLGQAGIAARAVVLAIVGGFFCRPRGHIMPREQVALPKRSVLWSSNRSARGCWERSRWV